MLPLLIMSRLILEIRQPTNINNLKTTNIMKHKILSLLLLGLVCSIGNVWGETYVLSQSTATEYEGDAKDYKAKTFVSNSQTFTIAKGGTSGVAGKGAETDGKTLKLSKNATYTITLPTGFTITAINFKGYSHSDNTDSSIDQVNGSSSGFSNLPSNSVKDTESSWADLTKSITGDAQTTGTITFHVANKQQVDVIITITGTPAPTTPSLIGAWSATSGTIWNGDEAPSPSFGVTASNSATLTGSDYSVSYSVKSGSDDGLITITGEGAGFTLNNSVNGTATLVAMLSSANEENYTTPSPNTFEYVYTVNAKVPTYTLDKADNAITLRSTPIHREASTSETATVTMSADFLEGTSGTVAFTSDVNGLSVSPTSFTISSGSVASTTFTITYNSASGASGTATLRFTDGNSHTKDLAIDYASIVAHEWATVSTATTWDWTKLTGDNVQLSTSTTPTNSAEFLLGDMDGEVLTQNIGYDPSTFNADALKVVCQYPVRDKKYLQGHSVKFQTSVPGTVTVVFSNTGKDRPYRHLKVNDVVTEFKSATSSEVTASNIYVPAGEVTITGYIPDASDPQSGNKDAVGATMLRIYSITFTPLAESVPTTVGSTITACGYNTFSSIYPLDLSTLTDGMTAYVVSEVSDGKAVLTASAAKVPARTGLIIKGTASTAFTIATTADETTAPAANLLVGVPNGTTLAKADGSSYNNYVLGWETASNPGFYLINGTSATLTSGKAYLHTSSTLSSGEGTAPSIIRIVDEENNATYIEAIDSSDEAVKFIENGQFFILKNGITYDLLGRIVK